MYFKKIDGLRFLAISFVLIEHFASYIGNFFSAGYFGVDLFFVISGFLITSILLKANDRTLKQSYLRFIGRRTLRIFPIYYGTILLLFLFRLPFVTEFINYLLTYTYNYSIVFRNIKDQGINHFWSLCVEEQFYLFWPLIVLLTLNHKKLLLAITVCIIIAGYTQMTFELIEFHNPYNLISIITRSSSLAFGALGAILLNLNYIPKYFLNNKYVEFSFMFILLLILPTTFKSKYFILGLCSFYFVLKASNANFTFPIINRFLENRKVIYIGTISYGIYVYHYPLSYLLTTYIFDPIWLSIDFSHFGKFKFIEFHSWIIKLPLYTVISIYIAHLSFVYIEKPILSLKDRYFKYE